MSNHSIIQETYDRGQGILRLKPVFVPRRFAQAGRRLRLHPDDYYALGTERGSIKERWFSSVIPAMNGPLAPSDEGMSYVAADEDGAVVFLFKDAVEQLGSRLIGESLYERYGTWPMYAKFFDYETPLFHHLHLDDAAASLVGRIGKPEAYYFPPQLNNHLGYSRSPISATIRIRPWMRSGKDCCGTRKRITVSPSCRVLIAFSWGPAGIRLLAWCMPGICAYL